MSDVYHLVAGVRGMNTCLDDSPSEKLVKPSGKGV